MPPARGNFGQRHENKAALAHPGMRQDQPVGHNPAIIIDQIDIQSPWGIRRGTHSREFSFHRMQKGQEFNRLKASVYGGDSIDERRIGRVGPGRRSIERRLHQDFDTQLLKPGERSAQRLLRQSRGGRNIGA